MDKLTPRMLRDPFVWGFCLLEAVAFLPVVSVFFTSWALPLWIRLAEWRHGPLDAPDNWAMGFDYCRKTAMLVGGIGVASAIAGLVRAFRRRQGDGG